ncbi:MAG: amidohydrolase family protein [Peptococcaceae bacterium]|jgi:adenine deaminase|nr:amidohydrolase family protein [Peptococcaceae bacterium]
MGRFVDAYRYEDLPALVNAGRGLAPLDLVITNAKIVDVITETTAPGEIWVKNGVVVHVERGSFGQFKARQVFDAKGAYVAPGLMDSHVHIESSMMSPYYFGRAVVVHGTTAVFTDPHEITNVAGQKGIDYMYQNSRVDPVMRQFILVPSCVPAVPKLESAGAVIGGADVEYNAGEYPDAVIGLAEVMDYIGVINGDPRMTEILNAARAKGLYLQSHYSGIHGRDLSAYLLAGLGGNHEIRGAEDAEEVLRAGGWVDFRGSSSIDDSLNDLLPALRKFPNPSILRVTLCTDDVHAADLADRAHGHINKVAARVVAFGIAPETAIAYATRNVAQEYGIENLGVIRAGNLADFIVFNDFAALEPTAVFVGGVQQVADGKLVSPARPELARPAAGLQAEICQTMRLGEVKAEKLIPAKKTGANTALVNTLVFDGLFTKPGQETLPLKNGQLDLSGRDDLCFIAVCDRYGLETVSLGVLRNFGLRYGAVATTVSHDSHNLTLIYKDPETAAYLANRLIGHGGGVAAAADSGHCRVVELPAGGLMSLLPAEELAPKIHGLETMLPELFGPEPASLLKMAVLTLPVIPEIRVTNKGVVNTVSQEFIPLFPEP